MNNLHKLAQEIIEQLNTIEVKDGSYRSVWKDNTRETLKEWFQGVSGTYSGYNLSQLDECYLVLEDLAHIINDHYNNVTDTEVVEEDIQHAIYENDWVDVATNSLIEWLAGNNERLLDVDEAIKNGAETTEAAIRMAQQSTRENMAASFLADMVEEARK